MKWDNIKKNIRGAAHKAEHLLRNADNFSQVVALAAAAKSPLAYAGVILAGARFGASLATGTARPAWCPPDIPLSLIPSLAAALGLVPGMQDRDWCLVDGIKVYAYNSGPHVCMQVERDSPELRAALFAALAKFIRAKGRHTTLTGKPEAIQILGASLPTDPHTGIGEEVWQREVTFLRNGRTRAVMLLGAPGTGKSTIARTLIRKVVCEWPDAISMRVAVADLGLLPASTIEAVLDSVRPDVVVLDDLERCRDEDGLLDLLERCHGRQRLIVATCNDDRRLSPALRRPGRIDDVWTVRGAGETLAAEILAQTRPDLAPRVASWPVKYITELADRIAHIDGVDVERELDELSGRVEEAAVEGATRSPMAAR